MELIDFIKQFARKQYLVISHYPREHLLTAAGLGGLALILLLLPDGEQSAAAAPKTEIALEIDLKAPEDIIATSSAANESVVLSDFVVPAEAEPEVPQVFEDISLWQNIEVKSGDNLSAIFSKVGLSDQDLFRVLNSSDEAK
ncbi:unnamed protein product, partial [Scytosiphon promiscuus]